VSKVKKIKISYQTLLGTVVAINLMFIALLIGQHLVAIEETVPSLVGTAQPDLHIEYVEELIGTDIMPAEPTDTGSWTVEHYKEYEYHYDPKGHLVERRPTSKETHLRYWHEFK
jgi:hypothetical protein